MEEKMKIEITDDNLNVSEKLNWETPKLYSLDKGKTAGGPIQETAEDSYYNS